MPLGNGIPLFLPGYNVVRASAISTNDLFAGTALQPWWTATGLSATVSGDKCAISTGATAQRLSMSASNAAPVGSDYAIQARIKSLSSGAGMNGIVIVDANGTGVGYSPYNDGNTYMWNVATWLYNSTGPNNGSQPGLTDFWLELRKAGTLYKGRYSADGVTWSAYTSTINWGSTPVYFAMAHLYASSGFTYDLKQWKIIA